ncbi:unnamed protein product [Effrenium voratum]|nr:unnamed protein product [Effrenium voratum]
MDGTESADVATADADDALTSALLRRELRWLLDSVDQRLLDHQRIIERLLRSPRVVEEMPKLYESLQVCPGLGLVGTEGASDTFDEEGVENETEDVKVSVVNPRLSAFSAATTDSAVQHRRSVKSEDSYRLAQQKTGYLEVSPIGWIRCEAWAFLTALVASNRFQGLFACVIVADALVLGVQIEWQSGRPFDALPEALMYSHVIFAALFVAEIFLRFIVGPKAFFARHVLAWNSFDTMVAA